MTTKINVENNVANVNVKIEEGKNGTKVIIEPMVAQVELSELKPGDKFKIGEFAFVKLGSRDFLGDVCILDEFIDDGKSFEFGDNNDWKESKIREYLNNDFYKKLKKIVGKDNIKEFELDLMARDGLKDYGKCTDKVALLTERMYQDNREFLPKTGEWWWLATPFSTPSNDYTRGVCVVRGDGALSGYGCGRGYAVRPFCIFALNLLVSKVDE